ncbi:uncharacterized protein TEOVI_000816600 [Trypanosoma equiperdum]|uniref:Uncharacterized protein n=1 Tax=Trypanosoma equiperdum TaxID=5694 RepID=A0A1G4I6G5_TRYEQ|nr:hypothetical protein, conserved [Trypanosoma equiperdum]
MLTYCLLGRDSEVRRRTFTPDRRWRMWEVEDVLGRMKEKVEGERQKFCNEMNSLFLKELSVGALGAAERQRFIELGDAYQENCVFLERLSNLKKKQYEIPYEPRKLGAFFNTRDV